MTNQEAINSIIEIAKNEVDYLEKKSNSTLQSKTANAGFNNYTKYWKDLKPSYQGQPWCLCFSTWLVWKLCNEDKDLAKQVMCIPSSEDFTYYTPTGANYFKSAKRWTTTPSVGYFVFYKNSIRIYHVGFVYKVDNNYIYTIEGNTSSDNALEANGGAVAYKKFSRSLSSIAGYGMPRYDLLKDIPSDSTSNIDNIITSDIKVGGSGLKIVSTGSLNVRSYPVTGNVITTLARGSIIYPTKKTYINNAPWFYIGFGWISGKYIEGWIQESNGKWWYVTVGYQWVSSGKKTIDDVDYYFDADGYLVENKMFELDGEKVYVKYGGELAKKEWVQVGSNWYYAKDDNTLATSEFILLDHNGSTELFYFKDDSTMYTGELKLKTNERGALTL